MIRSSYKVAWNGWEDDTGGNTTWEPESTVVDDENKHFLESWQKDSELYKNIEARAKINPLEVDISFPLPSSNERYVAQNKWREILRKEGRDEDEELPFWACSLFTSAYNMDWQAGNLKKVENYNAGLVDERRYDFPPGKRARKIFKTPKLNYHDPKAGYHELRKAELARKRKEENDAE